MTDAEYLKQYAFHQYTDAQIEVLIQAANRFESERKLFIANLVFREKAKPTSAKKPTKIN